MARFRYGIRKAVLLSLSVLGTETLQDFLFFGGGGGGGHSLSKIGKNGSTVPMSTISTIM